jgi:8-oxo-dGTP diphosphatase
VLVARRHDDAHQGGLWEFPGGKLEPGESPLQGLGRELEEEIGILVLAASPLVRVHHDYPERAVLLDVWHVTRWRGEPRGAEGQPLRWMQVTEMQPSAFPPADGPVIDALLEVVGR